MLYEVFEKMLSTNLTNFIDDENVTVNVRNLITGHPHIEILRGGKVTAEIVYCVTRNEITYIEQEDFVRYIKVDLDGNKFETADDDCEYLKKIVKYFSEVDINLDSK